MRAVRQMGNGIFYGLVSVMLVVGGLSLALAESYIAPSPTATPSLPTVAQTLTSTQAGIVPSSVLLSTNTPMPPTNCPPPAGWILIPVQPNDTLEGLASRYGIAAYQLAQANCLLTSNLAPGYNLYVPPLTILPTSTSIPCGIPFGWVHSYAVRPGDTLYQIATSFGTTVSELQRANCLFTTLITPGNILWVPNVPIITPSAIIILDFGTLTPAPTDTAIPTETSISATATCAPTATSTLPPPPTATVTPFPSATP